MLLSKITHEINFYLSTTFNKYHLWIILQKLTFTVSAGRFDLLAEELPLGKVVEHGENGLG